MSNQMNNAKEICLEGKTNRDIVVSIMSHLELEDVLNLKLVNKKFRDAGNTRFIKLRVLKKKNLERFGEEGLLKFHACESELWCTRDQEGKEVTEEESLRRMIQAELNVNFSKGRKGYGIKVEGDKVFRGWFEDGMLSGLGVGLEVKSKRVLEGFFVNGGTVGRITMKTETTVYNGPTVRQKENGLGTLVFTAKTSANSFVYQGAFKEGKFNGNGRFECEGYVYTGNFVMGMRDGMGLCSHKNGDYMEGIWKDGNFVSGKAKLGKTILEGEFEGNKLTGTVREKEKDGKVGNERNESLDDVNGFQTVIRENGEEVTGVYTKGKINGRAVISLKKRVTAITEMKDNISEGVTIIEQLPGQLLVTESKAGRIVRKIMETRAEQFLESFRSRSLEIGSEANPGKCTFVKGDKEGCHLLVVLPKEEKVPQTDYLIFGQGGIIDLTEERMLRTFVLTRDFKRIFGGKSGNKMALVQDNGVRFFNIYTVEEMRELRKEKRVSSENAICLGDLMKRNKLVEDMGFVGGVPVSMITFISADVKLFEKSRRNRRAEKVLKGEKGEIGKDVKLPGRPTNASWKIKLAENQIGESSRILKDPIEEKIRKDKDVKEAKKRRREKEKKEKEIKKLKKGEAERKNENRKRDRDPLNLLDPESEDIRFFKKRTLLIDLVEENNETTEESGEDGNGEVENVDPEKEDIDEKRRDEINISLEKLKNQIVEFKKQEREEKMRKSMTLDFDVLLEEGVSSLTNLKFEDDNMMDETEDSMIYEKPEEEQGEKRSFKVDLIERKDANKHLDDLIEKGETYEKNFKLLSNKIEVRDFTRDN